MAGGIVQRPGGRTVEAPSALRALVDECDRRVDGVDRRVVGLLGGVSPDDEPVLCQHDQPQAGRRPHGLADLLGECEPGTDVGDPGRGVAEALAHELLAVLGAGEDVDAVRVRVVNMRGRHERVQQRLDRRPRHRGIELAAHEVRDHLLVAHLRASDQREDFLQAQHREALRPDRGEVAARALDPHHGALVAGVIDGGALGRGVAAAEVGDGAVGAQQVRRAHECGEGIGHVAVRAPEIGSGGDQLGRGAHGVPPRSAAIRAKRPDARSAAMGSSAAPSALRACAQSGRTSVL